MLNAFGAQIIISRKHEVERLEEEGEEGMAHSLLSGLPELYDGDEMGEAPLKEGLTEVKVENEVEEDGNRQNIGRGWMDTGMEQGHGIESNETISLHNTPLDDNPAMPVVSIPINPTVDPEPKLELGGSDSTASLSAPEGVVKDSQKAPTEDILEQPILQHDSYPSIELEDEDDKQPSTPPSPAPGASFSRPKVSLSSLLLHADFLYSTYPSVHPALFLTEIMGPNSVINTWSPAASILPTDDDAESMVLTPALVVYPDVEEDLSVKKNEKRTQKRLRRFVRVALERRMMVAGAVFVLGVAMAVYGIRNGHNQRFGHGGVRDWRRLGGQLGDVIVSVSGRVLELFWLR